MKSQNSAWSECLGNRYLNLSLLRPGDVILTYPAGLPLEVWESYAIARVTGGVYSHAILVLQPTLWYESEDHGVGPSLVNVDRIEYHGDTTRLLKCKDHWQRIAVFRHPSNSSRSVKDLSSELTAITDGLSFKRYPRYTRIAHDLQVLSDLPFRDNLLNLAEDTTMPPDLNRGLFCSEVVAYAYKGIRLPFTRHPSQVSPSDIANHNISGLEEIDPFCEPDPSASVLDGAVMNLISEQAHRALFVGQLTKVETLGSAVAEIAQKVIQEAIEGGVPPEKLTPEGFPLTFSEVLGSLNTISLKTGLLIVDVGLGFNANPDDPLRLEQGANGLEELLELIKNGKVALLDLATTYGNFVKPIAKLDVDWRPKLEQTFRYYDGVGDDNLKEAGRLYDAFSAALKKHLIPKVRGQLKRFVEIIDDYRNALYDLNEIRARCWSMMYPDHPSEDSSPFSTVADPTQMSGS